MNGALLLAAGCLLFGLAYRFYGRMIERLLGVDPNRPTPAHTRRDGLDYMPTRPAVLFGHHFASIAGAGPIVGPVLAAQFGWAAVALWIILGCILIGAMHDMVAMFLSVRHEGRSIGIIIESLMGYWGRLLFLLFCLFALILIIAQFTDLVAGAFISTPAVATALILFILLAGIFGALVYRRGVNLTAASFIFVPLMFGCVWVGARLPLDLQQLFGCGADTARAVWTALLLAYCFTASVMPIWLLLQPCGYLNSFLLFAMMALGILGIFVAAPTLALPAFTGWMAPGSRDAVIPMLFVTVACGACSGFHALVASGTSAKQLANERHLRPVAYGGMLVEGILALIALIAVAWMTQNQYVESRAALSPVTLFARGVAGFTTHIGLPQESGAVFISLALAAFLITTLDTATRLARFIWQELFLPRAGAASAPAAGPGSKARAALSNRGVATAVAIVAAAALLIGGGSRSLWPIFASTNQLLAALTLLGAGLWLARQGKRATLVLPPMLLMLLTSGGALLILFLRNVDAWRTQGFSVGGVLALATGCLLVLAAVLAGLGAISFRRMRRATHKG